MSGLSLGGRALGLAIQVKLRVDQNVIYRFGAKILPNPSGNKVAKEFCKTRSLVMQKANIIVA